ncbi:MAG: cytochrome c3 family protein [candidate division KSB1 bacterium]
MSSLKRRAWGKAQRAWRTPFTMHRALCALLFFGLFETGQTQVATVNHPHGNIKIPCGDCHTTKGWSPLRQDLKFRHEQTSFGLEGQHASVACKQCHASLKFTGAAKECRACHEDVHDGTLGKNCARCHTLQGWQEGSKFTFMHQESRFPLLGRHQHLSCDNCHTQGGTTRFINLPLQCGACHIKDFEATANPNHKQAGFSIRCEQCHSSMITGWQPAGFAGQGFDHNRTAFPLLGAHNAVDCARCHVNNRFAGTPKDCFSCHQNDFQNTTNPNHVASNYSRDCLLCHSNNAWRPATFDHNRTRFPLTGAHLAVACDQCHANNRYAGTPMDCFSCHQTDFQNTSTPNHVAANFSRDCATCHTTGAWKPSTFDHSKTRFALMGAHTATACNQCHVNNRYAGTPRDCFSCHQADFQRPTNPNHVAFNFSRDCTVCHTLNAWLPATFDHDSQYFRIYSGKHRGKWQSCATCHVNAANYKSFECILCHEHNQTKMDDKHRGRSGYLYDSQSCYRCHPRV